MVEFRDVSVTYSNGVDALYNVNLKINDGDFAFVVGPSGAGKSTMIKLLLREIDASSGDVLVNGYNLRKLKKRDIPYLRRTIGFVFQDFRLIRSMTVYENIAFVLRVIDAPKRFIKKRVQYVVSLVRLENKVNAYPDELSGGEKQRCAIARALVNDPDLIIADEPTGNIDPELSYEIVELLKSINDRGTTILMVTHEHDLVRHFGGRIININKGEVTFDNVISGDAAAENANIMRDIEDSNNDIFSDYENYDEDDNQNQYESLNLNSGFKNKEKISKHEKIESKNDKIEVDKDLVNMVNSKVESDLDLKKGSTSEEVSIKKAKVRKKGGDSN